GAGDVHAGGAGRLDANAGDGGPRENAEIRALESRHQQGSRGRIPASHADGALAKSIPFRIETGEIIAGPILAERRKSIEERLIQAIGFRNESHMDGSVGAVYIDVAPVGIVLRHSKVRQHLLPAPACV